MLALVSTGNLKAVIPTKQAEHAVKRRLNSARQLSWKSILPSTPSLISTRITKFGSRMQKESISSCDCKPEHIFTVKSFEGLAGVYQCPKCKKITVGHPRDCEGKIIKR